MPWALVKIHTVTLFMQTFVPYGSPYTMPIPQDARPSAVTSASSVNYPDVSSGGVMALANATTDFALRFVGESSRCDSAITMPHVGPPCGSPCNASALVGSCTTRLQHAPASANCCRAAARGTRKSLCAC